MDYIAVIPPSQINEQVLKWKEWVKAETGAVRALSSPGHITLVPPFILPAEKETDLIQSLDKFASVQTSFSVQLEDFSHFQKRTIYLKVTLGEELNRLRENLFDFLNEHSFPIPQKEDHFSPHITIAFRDLKRNGFTKAWNHFREINFEPKFDCDNISLLRHNKKSWDVINRSVFGG